MNLPTVAAALALALPAGAWAQAPARPGKTASAKSSREAQLDTALTRMLGHDPSLAWRILSIRPSSFPGLTEAVVSINKGAPLHFFISPDQKSAIIGEEVPFGPDPFASARAKLRRADGPARGADRPSCVIVEFCDLASKECRTAHASLQKLAGDNPGVRIIFQPFPLQGEAASWSAMAADYADCAGRLNPDFFWKFADSIFQSQERLRPETADDELRDLAAAAGYDMARLSACAAAPGTRARVKRSVDLGVSLGVEAVPAVFINGRKVMALDLIPYSHLMRLVVFESDRSGR